MLPRLCLVVGDGPTKWDDLEAFWDLRPEPHKICCVNHVGLIFPCSFSYWVSWHADWLAEYSKRRPGVELWSPVEYPGVNLASVTQPYGSSGMSAPQIMLDTIGFERVVLAGIPLGGKYEMYHPAWPPLKRTRGDRIRALSGYTAELFGTPSVAFVRGKGATDSRRAQDAACV